MKNVLLLLILYLFFVIISSCNSDRESKGEVIVTKVYPTSDTLPENLLRMYILFSRPMKTVGNLEKIRLLNDTGSEVKGAIFNNVYELWDEQQTQLTLIFDPGRVKTGLKAHEQMGRALKPGKSYQLLIDGLEDVNHQKLAKTFIKNFVVSDADTIAPDINSWKISLPAATSRDSLLVTFTEMIDQLSLKSRLVITDNNRQKIDGTMEIGLYEKSWTFIPDNKWVAGNYYLFINTRLEDPSGNNLNGLFDHKAGSLKSEKEGETLNLAFSIK